MAKCVRCDNEMCSFTLAERGRCNCCGFDVEDMAEILSEMLAALKPVLIELETHHLAGVTERETCPICRAIKRARVIIAKVGAVRKGEGNDVA